MLSMYVVALCSIPSTIIQKLDFKIKLRNLKRESKLNPKLAKRVSINQNGDKQNTKQKNNRINSKNWFFEEEDRFEGGGLLLVKSEMKVEILLLKIQK